MIQLKFLYCKNKVPKKKVVPKQKIVLKAKNNFLKRKNFQDRLKQFEKSCQLRQKYRKKETKVPKAIRNVTKKSSSVSTEKQFITPKISKKDEGIQTFQMSPEFDPYSKIPVLSPVRPNNVDNQFMQMNNRRFQSSNFNQNMNHNFLPIIPMAATPQF